MNFRKLLAFVLVFSLATQPGSVRFSYAEDIKAAEEIKIEEKTEASDELAIEINESELDEYLFDPGSREQKLEEAAPVAAEETAKTSKISGALAGAIAAGVAAVTVVVGTAGLMIYNGVSNKDEIAKLWTSEDGSFFSRLSKTISILFKGANEASNDPVEEPAPAEEEKTEDPVEHQIQVEEKTQPTGIDSVDESLCDEVKLGKEYCDKLAEKLTDKEQEVVSKDNESMEQAGTESEQRVDNDAQEETTEEPAPAEEERTKNLVEEQAQSEEKAEESVEGPTLAEEEKTEDPVEEPAPAEEEKTEDPVEHQIQVEEKTQPTGIDSVDKSLCDEAKLGKEYCDKLAEKLTDKEQESVSEEHESTEQSETESEQRVDITEDNNPQTDISEESSTGEKPKTKALDNLDSQIKEIISGFGEIKKSYVEKETKKYVAKFEELQNMHDTDTAVEKLKQIKKDLQTKLVKLKKACQNNPKACGKE